MSAPHPVYTIGHSTRTIADFVDLPRVGRVELVVDNRIFKAVATAVRTMIEGDKQDRQRRLM